MAPSVSEGDVMFASSLFRPGRGDIAIVRDPTDSERLLHKRVKRIEREWYCVEGDNREQSRDSRQFGPVPRHLVLGRAWAMA